MNYKVHLIDGSFFPRERSATLAGDNSGLGPAHFEWTAEPTGGVTFYTDVCLEQAVDAPGRKVAWLLEPPWKPNAYETAWKLREHFDYILTYHHIGWGGHKQLFYPLGGSWIRDWGVHPKSKLVSIIASEKNEAQGHKLRHGTIARYGLRLDVMGRGYRPIEGKAKGLRDYCYSVVIESWRGDWYFSEKLIDCLSQGTIPIYWGCPNIGRFFNTDGILRFYDLDRLGNILASISKADYVGRLDAVRDNLKRARQYRCAEDWIFEKYPFLFEAPNG
jgi:hypothetical protein